MPVGCHAAYDVTEYILSGWPKDNIYKEMRYMSLGSNICFLRKQKQYTQEQFAEKMGVTRQTVSRWESDEVVPELAKLVEISDIFACRLDTLVKENLSDRERFIQKFRLKG